MMWNNGQIRDELLRPRRPEQSGLAGACWETFSRSPIFQPSVIIAPGLSFRSGWRVHLLRWESRGVFSGKLTPETTIISCT